jgi:hypothetical protein
MLTFAKVNVTRVLDEASAALLIVLPSWFGPQKQHKSMSEAIY